MRRSLCRRPAATAADRGQAGRAAVSNQVALADDPTIKSLTAKLNANPDDASALYRRGQVYASKGAYSLAIKDFDDTLRLNPKDVEALNNRCWARTVVGDLQSALKDCNEALRLRPNFVDALDSRGLVNLKSGLTKNAIADFDAALKDQPAADLVAVWPGARQAAQWLDFGGQSGYRQCQGDGPEHRPGIRQLRGTVRLF